MTSRPRLAVDINYRNGVGAVLLFAVLAWTFLTAGLARPAGFAEGGMTRSIGFAMFDMLDQIPAAHGETEGFLVAFVVVALVLDAALDGAVMLARREEDGSVVTAIADGGRLLGSGTDGETGTERPDDRDVADGTPAESVTDGAPVGDAGEDRADGGDA